MATAGSPSCASITATVSAEFHYETKYVLLNYLRMLPHDGSPASTTAGQELVQNMERMRIIKQQMEEELRQLEGEISAAAHSSGFDQHRSQVFSPLNPERSVEDCLAEVGDAVVAELGAHLAVAVQTLLAGPLDYQRFQNTTLDLSAHTEDGWNKVLVPLVLLQALQSEGQPLSTLLELGLRFLKEEEADYIMQIGGWGGVLGLVPEKDHTGTIAEDSNDIYILSEEKHPEQLSLPSSLLGTGDISGEQDSWQTESLPVSLAIHESWAQVSAMDPEDIKILDINEGVALAEERSENNSSNSDIVHVEREEAELLEEGGEGEAIDDSMMSVLGTETDIAELRAEFGDEAPARPASGRGEATPPASLLSLEEPVVIETPPSLSTEPSFISSEPELLPSGPVVGVSPPAEPLEEPLSVAPVETGLIQEPAEASAPTEEENKAPTEESEAAPADPEASPEPVSEPQQEKDPAEVPQLAEPELSASVSAAQAPETLAVEAPVAPFEFPPVEPLLAPKEDPVEAQVVPENTRAGSLEILNEELPVPTKDPPGAKKETPLLEKPKKGPAQPESPSKLPYLLYGGAVLALLAAIAGRIILFRRR